MVKVLFDQIALRISVNSIKLIQKRDWEGLVTSSEWLYLKHTWATDSVITS